MDRNKNILANMGRSLQRQSGAPLYTQLAGLLRQGIETGGLRHGDSLIPQRQLSTMWKVSEVTVRRALQALAAEGLLEARAGSGTTVTSPRDKASSTGKPSSGPRRHRLGIVSAQLTDGYPFLSRMMDRLQESPAGHIFQFFSVPVDESDVDAVQRMLPLRELDGLLLMSPVNLNLVAMCQRQKVPYVLLYNHVADGRSRCVVVDYGPGIMEAVEHLVAKRRRQIALVTALESRFSTGQMTDAYHAALRFHKLPIDPKWSVHAGYKEAQGYQATRELLARRPRPDAIIFASDYQARGGLIALQEAGLSVPKHVAVIGAGRMLRDKEWPVALTTIDLHFEEVGIAAVDALCALIDETGVVPFRQIVSSSLILGETS
jgi:DNA-binding LacI/PurR family transcriptional regulator